MCMCMAFTLNQIQNLMMLVYKFLIIMERRPRERGKVIVSEQVDARSSDVKHIFGVLSKACRCKSACSRKELKDVRKILPEETKSMRVTVDNLSQLKLTVTVTRYT